MAEENRILSSWSLRVGPYLGEISALAFLPISSSPFPLLLAGTGSEILVYDVASAELLKSVHVFEGVRVHGITCDGAGLESMVSDTRIVVFGEKRVKMFLVSVTCDSFKGKGKGKVVDVHLELECQLLRFDQWVLDALFIKEDSCVALGLGDNSVAVWDIASSKLILRVASPDRCLLYSLRLWGSNLETLRVASGTIYNEIIVWQLISQGHCLLNISDNCHSFHCNEVCLLDQQYRAAHLIRLCGHEGSIFRIAWSQNGSKLMSVSDDRSARIWNFSDEKLEFDASKNRDISVVILYGHDARIWDCCISDNILITVGEDCSCRFWGMNGKELKMIKEHIGRGIWRCLYDPGSKTVITAGFDSAIKVHRLQLSSSQGLIRQNEVLMDFSDRVEIFLLCIPDASKQLKDSKSEYVRCLYFTKRDILYVATNHGFLYHVKLNNSSCVKWTQLARISEDVPLICMDFISLTSPNDSVEAEDIVAIGDGRGNATILWVVNPVYCPKIASSITWIAESERQLLGIFWSKSLGCSHLFTADPLGFIKLWGIDDYKSNVKVPIVFSSLFGTRITCLDVSLELEVLVCGDQRGNLSIFPFQNSQANNKIHPMAQFKGAHGISSVSTVSIGFVNSDEVEFRTTGGDGCICYFKFTKSLKCLEFTGMKQLKELSIIRSVIGSCSFDENLAHGKYAIGFTSSGFIIWNIMDDIKISHVSCGGWRRPYSFHFGDLPEIQNCFTFLKDNTIYVHRLWVPSNESLSISKVLHFQFHGREIHTMRFICFGLQDCLIATGCEDGSVRLTSRSIQSNSDKWSSSRLLGEHVGGSAVRSLCFLSRMHMFQAGQTHSHALPNRTGDPCLLISVGAKQVLTSWLLRTRSVSKRDDFTGVKNAEIKSTMPRESSSVTFQWLSTHMPQRSVSMHKGHRNLVRGTVDKNENDWRYLAVSGFLVDAPDCRFTVCFIVVACSDATLTLRALLLPHRLWFDVAELVPQTSPVLALQHVVLPIYSNPKNGCQVGNAHVIISGSTDGSITFWDLTESVGHFMQSILAIEPEIFIDCQGRPRTGRGSQGGRWWKSSHFKSETSDGLEGSNAADITNTELNIRENENSDKTSPSRVNKKNAPLIPTDINSILAAEICEVKPLLVLDSIHQSGVNCLHVSKMDNSKHLNSGVVYCVLSGGDDQSLHCVVFSLEQIPNPSLVICTQSGTSNQSLEFGCLRKCSISNNRSQNNLLVLERNRITSAHSSAVKGVWTDGIWVFSVGLDQRIRCWHLNASGILTEHSHLIISVPEPETLDALMRNRNHYEIAVGGRGMQMVAFVDGSSI